MKHAPFALRIDEIDAKILRLLQQDAGLPQREIAERVGLSAPAVQRRIARMQADGVIQRTVAVVDPRAIGNPITVIVEVTLTTDRSDVLSAAKAFFREAAEVQQCYCVAGTAALVVILLVPALEAYEERTARLFGDNELVRAFRTVVVLDRIKTGLEIPI